MHNISNCCFNAVIDILKLEDEVENPFQVQFFMPDILERQGLCCETFMVKGVVKT